MKDFIKNNKISFIIVSICLLLIIFVSSFVIISGEFLLDNVVYEFLINNFSCSFMDKFMITVTKLGNTNFVILFSSFIFFLLLIGNKEKKLSFFYIFSVVVITFMNQFLKFTIKRVRPSVDRLIEIGGYSFPSGHAMVSTVLYGLLAYIAYKCIKINWFRNVVVVINVLIILLIGISRIYVGVHYFSDVVVGFLISVIFLVFITSVLEKKVFSQN